MTIVLGIILIAAVGWVVINRADKAPQLNVSEARAAAGRTTQQIGSTLNELLGKLRGRFDRSTDYQTFKSWMVSLVDAVPGADEGAVGFHTWLDALATPDLKAFRSQLASFCQNLDIEEAWLHTTPLGQRADLRRALDETVGFYALAYARGAGQHSDIARAHAFQHWLAAPDRLGNRTFGAKLYATIVAQGMATPPPEMLLAPERQRRAFANQAIRELAARDPQAFDAVLAKVLSPAPKAQPVAETPPDQVVIPATLGPQSRGESGISGPSTAEA